MRQCSSCGGVKDRGHVCPTLSPSIVEIDGRSYIVPGEVACVFQAVSEERDELLDRLAEAQEKIDDLRSDGFAWVALNAETKAERDQLREAVRMFVQEMKSQDIMLPGEYDTMADLVGGNDGL